MESLVQNKHGFSFQIEAMRMLKRCGDNITESAIVADSEIESQMPKDNKKAYVFYLEDGETDIVYEEERNNCQIGDRMEFSANIGKEILDIKDATSLDIRNNIQAKIKRQKAILIVSSELDKELTLYKEGKVFKSFFRYLYFIYKHGR